MPKKINLSIVIGIGFFLAGFASGYLTFYYQEYAHEAEMIDNGKVFIKDKNGQTTEQTVLFSQEEKEAAEQELNNKLANLDSSVRLIEYLNSEYKVSNTDKNGDPQAPAEFFKRKEGNFQDLAVFASYALKQKGCEAGIIKYHYRFAKENEIQSYAIAIFRDKDLPKYIVLTEQGIQAIHHGWSFADLIKKEEERIRVKIFEYAFFPPGSQNLESNEWIKVN